MNRGLFNVPRAPGVYSVEPEQDKRQLWITVATDHRGWVLAIMPSIGTSGPRGAIQRTRRLLSHFATKNERPTVRVERYNGEDHHILMGLDHIRIRGVHEVKYDRSAHLAGIRERQRKMQVS